MFKVLLIATLFSQVCLADDLLDVLDNPSSKAVDGLSFEKKSQIFAKIIKRPNPEQVLFLQFIDKSEFKKALYQWPSAFEGTRFAESDNGKALYGYLLFQNGLQVTGLENTFMANPNRIDPALIKLWRGLMQTNEDLWTLADIKWNKQWTEVFGVPAQVVVTSRRFDSEPTIAELEELLRLTTANTWERSWTEWRFITSLIQQGEDIKAAKLLKHLQSVEKNNPVSKSLMNLTAARVLYQNGYLDQAIRYYGKIDNKSDYWFEAVEEQAWAELRLGRPQNTLAHSQTLLTPALAADIGPEPFYLDSLANLKICDYGQVSEGLKSFRSRFKTKASKLLGLKEQPDNQAVKKLFRTLAKGRARMPQLGRFGTELPRHSTRDENLFFLVQRHTRLAAESEQAKRLYSQSLAEGTALVGFQAKMEKFRKSIAQRARNSYTASLNRVRALADSEITEISSVLKKMQIVEAELIQQLSLSDRVISDTSNLKVKLKKGTTGSKDKYSLSFPFQGELWFDELNNYQIDVAKGCQSGKTKAM